ncbi:MAG TPA: hypothetical protein VF596_08365 [Pyrinomonadaceae bacterium]|jgi:hypothetical protein
MKRAMALFLVMVFSIGVMLPFTTDWSEAAKSKIHKKKKKKIKKYSKAWWKMYRAKKRRARLLAARRRALAKRRAVAAANARNNPAVAQPEVAATGRGKSNAEKVVAARPAPVLGKDAPVAAGGSDLEFRVADQNGQQIGSAQLSVIGVAMPQNEDGATEKTRKQMLAGVPVSALRRTVIDRMIKENGWIVNDYQRLVDGRRVFVVVAQSSTGGATQSRQFYFTEVDGRIYSLATNAPSDYSDKVAADSEKLLRAMSTNTNRPIQTADLR